METLKDFPVLLFESQTDWRAWLRANYRQPHGVWLKIVKKASAKHSVSYAEAVEEALCFGWIDSQMQRYDDDFYVQKFSPRGPKSSWSKANVASVEELIKGGRMEPAGLEAIAAAKANRRYHG